MNNNQEKNSNGCGCGCFTFLLIILLITGIPRMMSRFIEFVNAVEKYEYDNSYQASSTEEMSVVNDDEFINDNIVYSENNTEEEFFEFEQEIDIIYEYNLYDYTGFGLVPDNPATSITDIQETVLYLAMNDVPSPVSIYVRDITESDVTAINDNFDNTLIYACGYKNSDFSDYSSCFVEYDYWKKDCYYVYKNVVEGIDIPETEINAIELSDVVRSFMCENYNPNMSEYEIELTIHDYLVANTEYGHADEFVEDEHSAYGALVNHVAVCDGYARAYELLSICCGVESKLVFGTTTNGNHVWNISKIDGEWYQVDVTWDDPIGDTEGYDLGISHAYFNITDNYLSCLDHSWDRDYYPKCNSLQENYYVKNYGLTDYNGFVSSVGQNAINGNICTVAVSDYSRESYDINNIVLSTGYVGSWTWNLQLGEDAVGYQVISIYFH